MPNQLAANKGRQSITEHAAVLAAIAEIARCEKATTMDILRQALRDTVKARTADPAQVERLRGAVMAFTPKQPKSFSTPAKLASFKRAQREFDQLLLDLRLASAATIQKHNSIVAPHCVLRIQELE